MKFKKNARKIQRTVLALAVVLLSACGGGGGGSNPVTPPVVAPPVVTPPAGNLVMTMPSSLYVAGSAEQRNFDELNRLRINGGFGAAVYDPVLTKAAQAHVAYWSVHMAGIFLKGGAAGAVDPNGPGTDFHTEKVGFTGFTGVSPWDRAKAAAIGVIDPVTIYAGEGGTMSDQPLSSLDVMGQYSIATAHLQGALSYMANRVGMNFADKILDSSGNSLTVGALELGYLTTSTAVLPPEKAGSIVGIYPFDGMTGVGIGGIGQCVGFTVWGCPINILIQLNGPSLTIGGPSQLNPIITKFTLRKDGANVDVPAEIHEAGTPHGLEPTDAGWAILYPSVVLEPNTKYNVSFAGSLAKAPVSMNWSFTTGTSQFSVMKK